MRQAREDLDGRLCLGAWREGDMDASITNIWLSVRPSCSTAACNLIISAGIECILPSRWLREYWNWKLVLYLNQPKHVVRGNGHNALAFSFSLFFSSPHGGFSNSAHILNCTQNPWSLSVSLCLCFDGLSTPIIYLVLSEWPGWQPCVSTLLINNDQIHHSPRLENDIVLTCQCSLVLWNFE